MNNKISDIAFLFDLDGVILDLNDATAKYGMT